MDKIYRVLDDYEEGHYKVDNKLYSNADFYGTCYTFGYDKYILEENLDDIISHVQHGNTTCSKWISCSKDIIIDLEKYSNSNLIYQKNYRPNVAIIKGYDKSTLIIKDNDINLFEIMKKHPLNKDLINLVDNIRKLPISKVKKLAIDLNDSSLIYRLGQIGFIKTKQGTIPNLDSRALRYARDSKELLIFSNITSKYKQSLDYKNLLLNKEGIPLLLKPIVYDILYTLIKSGSIPYEPSDKLIYNLIKAINTFPITMLNSLEKSFYIFHYKCNYTMNGIINLYNNSNIDVLAFYNELLKIKRSVISKMIDWINHNLDTNYSKDIYLLDDKNYIIRSEGNYKKTNVVLIDGTIIQITPLENKSNHSIYIPKNNANITSILQYGEENKYYTLINGEVYKVYFENFDQTKQYIKKITHN